MSHFLEWFIIIFHENQKSLENQNVQQLVISDFSNLPHLHSIIYDMLG
jgi:hypothetical protein